MKISENAVRDIPFWNDAEFEYSSNSLLSVKKIRAVKKYSIFPRRCVSSRKNLFLRKVSYIEEMQIISLPEYAKVLVYGYGPYCQKELTKELMSTPLRKLLKLENIDYRIEKFCDSLNDLVKVSNEVELKWRVK